MLCPWCLHYGAEDDEYLFDEELFCGICAQQMPQDDEHWIDAYRGMDATMLSYIEEELNRIAVSKSGLQSTLLDAMGEGLATMAAVRESGLSQVTPEQQRECVHWVEFACTYFAPRLR